MSRGKKQRGIRSSRNVGDFESLEMRRVFAFPLDDLDADGDIDVIEGKQWYENYDGRGNFTSHALSINVANGITADLNGDGLLDVISHKPQFVLNEGNHQFGAAQTLTSTVANFETLRAVDLHRDGDLDLVGFNYTDSLYVFENLDGKAHFGPAVRYTLPKYDPPLDDGREFQVHAVDAALLRDDSLLDIGAVQSLPQSRSCSNGLDPLGSTWIYSLAPDLTFNRRLIEQNECSGPRGEIGGGVSFQHIDGDDRPDVVLTYVSLDGSSFLWFRDDGSRFTPVAYISGTGWERIAWLSDLNRDGAVDVVIPGYWGDRWVRLNDGQGHFSERPLYLAGEPPRVTGVRYRGGRDVIGDLNGDKVLDFLVQDLSAPGTNGFPRWADGLDPYIAHENEPTRDEWIGRIDALMLALRTGQTNPTMNYNRDKKEDAADFDYLIEVKLRTTAGDTNLDRVFDSDDFVEAFRHGEYEDAVVGNSTWRSGDWNGDGEFTTADIVKAFQAGAWDHRESMFYIDQVSDSQVAVLRYDVQSQVSDRLSSLTVTAPQVIVDAAVDTLNRTVYSVTGSGASNQTLLMAFDEQGRFVAQVTSLVIGPAKLQFERDGYFYAIGSTAIERFKWRASGLKSLGILIGLEAPILDPTLTVAADGTLFVALTDPRNNTLRIQKFDGVTGLRLPGFEVHRPNNPASAVSVLIDEDGQLLSIGEYGDINRFDSVTGQRILPNVYLSENVFVSKPWDRYFLGRPGEFLVASSDVLRRFAIIDGTYLEHFPYIEELDRVIGFRT